MSGCTRALILVPKLHLMFRCPPPDTHDFIVVRRNSQLTPANNHSCVYGFQVQNVVFVLLRPQML